MMNAIETHRETALNSPYSRDRREAIDELGRSFQSADADAQRHILETFRQVAHDATSRSERAHARDALVDAFEAAPGVAVGVVVPALCELAVESRHKRERLAAIDALRTVYPDATDEYREQIGSTLADIAGNATYEDERRRAQRRLTDLTADEQQTFDTDSDAERDAAPIHYLGRTLAEHLIHAADESPEACIQRAEELGDFLADHPVARDSYDAVRADLSALVEQLEVAPTGDGLDADRKQQVERIATRVQRLYERAG